MKKTGQIFLLSGSLVLAPSLAFADRAPTSDELTKIESVLKSAGFTAWDEIELEDSGKDSGKWEVDDAVGADGKKYDLKLDQSFNIIEKKLD